MSQKSFTFLELIIVVVIIGILASFGIVNYTATKERAIDKEAIANLRLIAAAEKIIRMEESGYVACADTDAVNSELKLSIPIGAPNWSYKVDNVDNTADPPTFTGKAQRVGNASHVFCVTQSSDPYDENAGCSW